MLTIAPRTRLARWAAGLIGCVLVALVLTASRLRLSVADPLIAGLAVCMAAWLAWVVVDFALVPLRLARAREQEQAAEAFGLLAPEFVDTQATWMAPGHQPTRAAGGAVVSQPGARRRDAGLAIDADG